MAFSGGIDSCAALALLRDSGCDVAALTLDVSGDDKALEQARFQASKLGVQLIIEDVRENFQKQIIDYFTGSYVKGETPAPCTVCNPAIKWRTLYDYAVANNFDKIATGHYFKITEQQGKYFVTRAADRTKDQSYYLWALPQEILSMATTPMGDIIKREIADYGKRSESMGVCFLRGKPYAELISQRHNLIQGDIVDKNGTVIGRHDSVALYTIGQKRGIGVEGVVVGIDGHRNRLIVGSDKELYMSTIDLREINIVDTSRLESKTISVMVRGYGRNPEGFCRVEQTSDGLRLSLDSPAWAVAKGQPVVLYDGDIVLGGGWVK